MKYEKPISFNQYLKLKVDAYFMAGVLSPYSSEERQRFLEDYLDKQEFNDWERRMYENTVNFPIDAMLYYETVALSKLNFDYEFLENKYHIPHHVLGEKIFEYQSQDIHKLFQTLDMSFLEDSSSIKR